MLRGRPQLLLAAILAAALATFALACANPPSPASGQISCASQFGSFSSDAHRWPPACWRPYGPRSPFNRLIPAHPRLARNSAAIIDYMAAHNWSFGGGSGPDAFTLDASGSRPVYWSQPSDPLIRVICRGGYTCQRGMRLRVPPGAQPESASDGHMVIVDQLHGREYDFWQASTPANGVMYVSSGNSIPIGVDSGTGLGGDASASYLGLLGGMIRAPELEAGEIDHALAMAVPCVQWHDVWPSPRHGHGDRVCGGGGPHFGTLLQLNMSSARINRSRALPWQKAIMRAMARYGVYVVDTDGSAGVALGWLALATEADQSFTSVGQRAELRSFVHSVGGQTIAVGVRLPISRFRVIAPCVPRGTC